MGRGAWWAADHGVAQSRTQLKKKNKNKKKNHSSFSVLEWFYLDLCLLAESVGLPPMEPAMASSIVERSGAREAGAWSGQAGFKAGKRDFPWWSSG